MSFLHVQRLALRIVHKVVIGSFKSIRNKAESRVTFRRCVLYLRSFFKIFQLRHSIIVSMLQLLREPLCIGTVIEGVTSDFHERWY